MPKPRPDIGPMCAIPPAMLARLKKKSHYRIEYMVEQASWLKLTFNNSDSLFCGKWETDTQSSEETQTISCKGLSRLLCKVTVLWAVIRESDLMVSWLGGGSGAFRALCDLSMSTWLSIKDFYWTVYFQLSFISNKPFFLWSMIDHGINGFKHCG